MPEGVLVDHHRDRISILEYFRVNAAIREALKPRVDLPSGGYIIIEPTEALTVIDVNSGSFTRSATARETVLWTNCEAATEIARQLRLRNLAGVIIVDFIDMDSRRDQLQVLEHFNKALRSDKARPQIAQLSELGLVELTRKRQGQNIYELFGQLCPTCGGLGHLVHLPGESERPVAREGIEPAVPAAFREVRTPDFPEPLDIPPVDDTDELDFASHSSYERPGVNNNNNRRRRRRRLDEPVPKEELLTKASSRPISVLQAKSEAVAESDSVGRDSAVAFSVSDSALAGRDSVQGVAGRGPVLEPREVGKPQLVRSPREIEPPEVITIEMTPEEQDVYALMGVSPLVRLNREVKNPKSVMLSVVLPGESGETQSASEPAAESSSELSTLSPVSDEAETSEQPMTSFAESPTTEDVESSDEALVSASFEAPTTEIPADSGTRSELDSSRPLIRRRRRRSSAMESED
jgi:ribonuclease E